MAEYDPAALETLKKLLRDHRNGETHDMDPRLYDQLFELAVAAKCHPHFEIISGYRSPESNDKMSSKPGSGVAKKSLHMQGRALDVRLKNCDCAKLRDLALAAKQGGVGYYERSDFVHIDTGRSAPGWGDQALSCLWENSRLDTSLAEHPEAKPRSIGA